MDKFKVRKKNQFRAAYFINGWSAFDGNLEIYPTPRQEFFFDQFPIKQRLGTFSESRLHKINILKEKS